MKPFDPNKTDPCHEQLISEDEMIELARRKHEQRQRDKKQAYEHCDDPSFDRRPESTFSEPAPEFPDLSHPMKSFFKFLVPLNDPWRLTIGFSVFFLLLNMVASRGWFNVIGLSAQASAESVNEIRATQLKGQIIDTIKGGCSANTAAGKQFYSGFLSNLLQEYQSATHRLYQSLPDCRTLGVRENLVEEP